MRKTPVLPILIGCCLAVQIHSSNRPSVLFAAGPEDLIDEDAALKQINTPAMAKKLSEQAAALAGERGGLLWAVSTDDGENRTQIKLDAPPVFDGMAAAGGRLYLALQSGTIVCLEGE